MNPIWTILRLFRRTRRRPRIQPEDFRVLDGALEKEAHHIRSVDPETASQWRVLHATLEHNESVSARARATPRLRRVRLVRPAIALAVTALVLLIADRSWIDQPAFTTYETTRGQLSNVVLDDSSEVMLNHTSALLVDLRRHQDVRHVTLNGEAYFRVQKSNKPFVVSTDVGTVRVLGTEFNVRVRDGLMEVAVVRGRVEVGARNNEVDSTVILSAGQITRSVQGGYPASPVQIGSVDYPGWMHGKLLFMNADLATVCREIEEKFDVSVTIGKPGLMQETITGALDARSANTAVATLARLTGTTYRNENGVYTLY